MTIQTEALFVYAGHTLRLDIFADETHASDVDKLGMTFNTVSVSSVELIEDGQLLGTYPTNFAENESADIITNELIALKGFGSTLESFEGYVRDAINHLIADGIFEAVN